MQLIDPFQIILLLQQRWLPLIGAFAVWVVLLIIHRIAKRNLQQRAIASGISPDAVNGIVLALRLGLLYVGIYAFFGVFPEFLADLGGLWNGASLLIGTAIGLAVGQAVSNLVSGLYIISTRPFGIGDYVRIGDKEGIIREISLNYTKILQQDGTSAFIPNHKALSSDLVNFAYDKSKLKVEEEKTNQEDSNRKSVLKRIRRIIDTKKVVRYVFTMEFHTRLELTKLTQTFEEVTKKWTEKFGFPPLYEITDVSNLSFTYLFTIFTDDPKKILRNKSKFMEDIIRRLFQT